MMTICENHLRLDLTIDKNVDDWRNSPQISFRYWRTFWRNYSLTSIKFSLLAKMLAKSPTHLLEWRESRYYRQNFVWQFVFYKWRELGEHRDFSENSMFNLTKLVELTHSSRNLTKIGYANVSHVRKMMSFFVNFDTHVTWFGMWTWPYVIRQYFWHSFSRAFLWAKNPKTGEFEGYP